MAGAHQKDTYHHGDLRRALIDAASNEELADLLPTLPFWGILNWKITPLSSNEATAKRIRQMSQRLQSAGQR